MCGIAGVFGKVDSDAVTRMVEVQAHRGPDAKGVWSNAEVPATLGHSRLSIIDLSAAGKQPMTYDDGRLCISYNGEIYNYRELREELQGLGYRFESKSDTEVVLAAYQAWGVDALPRLRGMFAFALIDARPEQGEPSLLLVRDRLGIKPLLFTEKDGCIWFASELRALLNSGAVSRQVDHEGLLDYLAFGSVTQPRTIIRDVETLPAAYWLRITASGRESQCYWDLHRTTADSRKDLRNCSFDEAVERVRHGLEEATRYHLVADVPVAAFLSGGIDSTAIVGLMSSARAGAAVKTFSVGFEGAHQAMDERHFARMAADHIGSDHQELVVTSQDAARIFDTLIQAVDQPSVDGANTWIVSEAAGRSVKVALSGLGGDEIFAGYDHFAWLNECDSNSLEQQQWRLRVLEQGLRLRRTPRMAKETLRRYMPAERYSALRRVLQSGAFVDAVRPEWRLHYRQRLSNRFARWIRSDADAVQRISHIELNGYLRDTLLRDADVMSMSHSLEIRPVLLDHPLVELVYALPGRHKLRDGRSKDLFVHAAMEYLPQPIRDRKKMGFALPVTGWMGKELRGRIEMLLAGNAAKAIFQRRYRWYLRERLRMGRPPYSLWAWAILLAWLEQEQIGLT